MSEAGEIAGAAVILAVCTVVVGCFTYCICKECCKWIFREKNNEREYESIV